MTEELSKEQALLLNSALVGCDELQLVIESGQVTTLDDVFQAVTSRSDAIEQQLAAAGLPVRPRNWR